MRDNSRHYRVDVSETGFNNPVAFGVDSRGERVSCVTGLGFLSCLFFISRPYFSSVLRDVLFSLNTLFPCFDVGSFFCKKG